jgi:hypothetical protein
MHGGANKLDARTLVPKAVTTISVTAPPAEFRPPLSERMFIELSLAGLAAAGLLPKQAWRDAPLVDEEARCALFRRAAIIEVHFRKCVPACYGQIRVTRSRPRD